jgi:hypothetical protein
MFLIGLGALLVLGGILYIARAAIWRGPLSGPDSSGRFATVWSRHGAACDSWGSERTGWAFSLWQSVAPFAIAFSQSKRTDFESRREPRDLKLSREWLSQEQWRSMASD